MFKLLALLSCFLLATQATPECSQLIHCTDQINEDAFFSQDSSMLAYIHEDQVMDVVCNEFSALTSCVNTHMPTCSDETVRDEAKAIKDIIEYMCTPAGRQLIVRLASSECASGPLMEVRLETMMQACLENFQFEIQMEALNAAFSNTEMAMSDFCPLIDQLKSCLVQGATGMCGADMGTFVSNIWEIAARDQFAEFGCSTTALAHKRRYVKRAIPMLMKRSGLIKKLRK